MGPLFFCEFVIIFEDATELSPPLETLFPCSVPNIYNYAYNSLCDTFSSE